MGKRKRRQLKNNSRGKSTSSDMLFIAVPLVITTIICCILVFCTFERIKKEAALVSLRDNMIQMEMQKELLSEGEKNF
ncbi:MAG: hypothetical protein ACI4F9_04665 [Lachnospiraceae bacterium]